MWAHQRKELCRAGAPTAHGLAARDFDDVRARLVDAVGEEVETVEMVSAPVAPESMRMRIVSDAVPAYLVISGTLMSSPV
jgi:hypothetical protein